MTETLLAPDLNPAQQTELLEVPSATNEDIIAYLRYSHKIAEVATLTERNTLILKTCEKLGITISDEELQTAGDAFRLAHKMLGASETLAWLKAQRISVEDWSLGIRVALLTKKLKEHLFGDAIDTHYLNNRHDFRRVALSQILLRELPEALKVIHAIREENTSFCALALEHSLGKQSRENGGFVGVRFVSELMPEVAQAIAEAEAGEILGPIQTKLGYHIIKLEKYYPPELTEAVRESISESFFQAWLQQ